MQQATIADARLEELYAKHKATTDEAKRQLVTDRDDVRFYDGKVKRYEFSVEKATKLLDEMGLKPGANGKRVETIEGMADGEATQVLARCELSAGAASPCGFRAPEPGEYRFVAEADGAVTELEQVSVAHAERQRDEIDAISELLRGLQLALVEVAACTTRWDLPATVTVSPAATPKPGTANTPCSSPHIENGRVVAQS